MCGHTCVCVCVLACVSECLLHCDFVISLKLISHLYPAFSVSVRVCARGGVCVCVCAFCTYLFMLKHLLMCALCVSFLLNCG